LQKAVLSGREVIKALTKVGFEQKRVKGSHVILVKFESDKKKSCSCAVA